MSEAKLRALDHFEDSEEFSDAERAVLGLADAITATPAVVPEDLFVTLKNHFDDADVVTLASALAWENYRARLNRVFDVEAEGYSEGAYCPLPVRE